MDWLKMKFQELIAEIDEGNHRDFLSNGFSVLNFFNDWNMGSLMALPVIESLAEDFFGKICFGKINVDEDEGLARAYGVEKVPCLIIFKNGKEVDRVENFDSEEVLRKKIVCLL